tara:strand:- start:1303 stop:1503 length:201 start_codon:yes stop_codon:yes gene_type:complete
MNIQKIDSLLDLWDNNKLEILWNSLKSLSQSELAYSVSWMTTMIRDDGEIRLSQWLVWLETKSKNQ